MTLPKTRKAENTLGRREKRVKKKISRNVGGGG